MYMQSIMVMATALSLAVAKPVTSNTESGTSSSSNAPETSVTSQRTSSSTAGASPQTRTKAQSTQATTDVTSTTTLTHTVFSATQVVTVTSTPPFFFPVSESIDKDIGDFDGAPPPGRRSFNEGKHRASSSSVQHENRASYSHGVASTTTSTTDGSSSSRSSSTTPATGPLTIAPLTTTVTTTTTVSGTSTSTSTINGACLPNNVMNIFHIADYTVTPVDVQNNGIQAPSNMRRANATSAHACCDVCSKTDACTGSIFVEPDNCSLLTYSDAAVGNCVQRENRADVWFQDIDRAPALMYLSNGRCGHFRRQMRCVKDFLGKYCEH